MGARHYNAKKKAAPKTSVPWTKPELFAYLATQDMVSPADVAAALGGSTAGAKAQLEALTESGDLVWEIFGGRYGLTPGDKHKYAAKKKAAPKSGASVKKQATYRVRLYKEEGGELKPAGSLGPYRTLRAAAVDALSATLAAGVPRSGVTTHGSQKKPTGYEGVGKGGTTFLAKIAKGKPAHLGYKNRGRANPYYAPGNPFGYRWAKKKNPRRRNPRGVPKGILDSEKGYEIYHDPEEAKYYGDGKPWIVVNRRAWHPELTQARFRLKRDAIAFAKKHYRFAVSKDNPRRNRRASKVKWIQDADARMQTRGTVGAFTRQARQAGYKNTLDFARHVKTSYERWVHRGHKGRRPYSFRTYQRAMFALNARRGGRG